MINEIASAVFIVSVAAVAAVACVVFDVHNTIINFIYKLFSRGK